MKFETQHLACEHGFITIIKTDDDDIDCGKMRPSGSCICFWPQILGPEPDWFEDEVEDLQKQVHEYSVALHTENADYRSQIDWDYLYTKGTQ